MSNELEEWLRSVLDEDERIARAAGGREWRWFPAAASVMDADRNSVLYDVDASDQVIDHLLRHDPQQVLAMVAAARQILDLHSAYVYQAGWDDEATGCLSCWYDSGADRDPYPCDTVRALAAVYQHRDGYRPEWAPSGQRPCQCGCPVSDHPDRGPCRRNSSPDHGLCPFYCQAE